MATKYFDNAQIFVDDDNTVFSGISYQYDFSIKEDLFKEYTISASEEFRPDKIAYELWDIDNLEWVLDEINNFNHIKEYKKNRVIYYLETKELVNMGIL